MNGLKFDKCKWFVSHPTDHFSRHVSSVRRHSIATILIPRVGPARPAPAPLCILLLDDGLSWPRHRHPWPIPVSRKVLLRVGTGPPGFRRAPARVSQRQKIHLKETPIAMQWHNGKFLSVVIILRLFRKISALGRIFAIKCDAAISRVFRRAPPARDPAPAGGVGGVLSGRPHPRPGHRGGHGDAGPPEGSHPEGQPTRFFSAEWLFSLLFWCVSLILGVEG